MEAASRGVELEMVLGRSFGFALVLLEGLRPLVHVRVEATEEEAELL